MHAMKRALAAVVVLAALSACTTLSDQDRALLTSANQNAEQAKQIAQQALTTAQAAQASAQAAQASAAQAAADAKSANEKADRMFQRGLRK